MFDAPAHLIEQRLRALDIGFGAAGKAEQLALPRRPRGAADRTFDKSRALAAHLFRQCDLGLADATVLISMNSLPFTSPESSPDEP